MADKKANISKPKPTFFTKNYLILVIVLIVLLCATIGLALAFAAPNLSSLQKWLLILSLIIFPFFSTAIVSWLILRHSNKLVVGQNDDDLNWETSTPEKQKRKLNNEVRALAKDLEIPVEQLSDLRSAYIVAEDLALRKVQSEGTVPIMHKISIGNADFDAISIDKDLITLIEVTFVVTPDVSQEKINAFLREASAAKNIFSKTRKGSKIRLLIVLVTQLDEDEMDTLRTNVRNKFKSTPVDVDIRLLDFLTLQKVYAED